MRLPLVVGALVAATAAASFAQPYFIRGEFNGWSNSDPMVQTDTHTWEYTVTGMNPGQAYEFKATVDDWSLNAPGSNAKYVADGAGEMHVYLYDTDTHGDGWNPEGKWRLGWDDNGAFNWELVGDMNGWNGGAGWELADLGGGVHEAEFSLSAGTYEYKFRSQGSWDFSIGDDFGNAAGNDSLTLASDATVRFTIDMIHGRWKAEVVPTPGSAMLMGLAGMVAIRRRR
ncbi:MAG: hypothetical protein IPJ41_11520 [Phycisphaerales bacterium]|nr:hypothetical protein [Phycisphaerales bacterium]